MAEASAAEFKRVIESQHSGIATFHQSVRLRPAKAKDAPKDDWDGIVHIFELKENPQAKRAYAWAAPISGSTRSRFFAVLHMGRVTGPVEAVKAAAAAINKWGAAGVR
jgi:hypothetical protein